MPELLHPYLPLTAPPTPFAVYGVAMERLRRTGQAEAVGPPLAGSRLDDQVEMRRVGAARSVPRVVPHGKGLNDVAVLVGDDQHELRCSENAQQRRQAWCQAAGLDTGDRGLREPGRLGEFPLAQARKAPDLAHEPGNSVGPDTDVRRFQRLGGVRLR